MKSCYKAGLIRVITLPDAEAAGIHGRLIMEMFPNMTVETKCIPDQRSWRSTRQRLESYDTDKQSVP